MSLITKQNRVRAEYKMYKDIREKMDYGIPQENRQERFIQLLNHYDYYSYYLYFL